MAEPNAHSPMAREPENSFESTRRQAGRETTLRRESWSSNRYGNSSIEYESHLRGGNQERNHREHNCPSEYRGVETPEGVERTERSSPATEIRMRGTESQEREITRGHSNEVRTRHRSPTLERSYSVRSAETVTMGSNMVLGLLNCEGFKAPIVSELIIDLSENHTKDISLCLQETWK